MFPSLAQGAHSRGDPTSPLPPWERVESERHAKNSSGSLVTDTDIN